MLLNYIKFVVTSSKFISTNKIQLKKTEKVKLELINEG